MDKEAAFECYKKAVEAGNKNAIKDLAECYYEGLGTNQDIDKAVELYTKIAEKGDTLAMITLADYFFYNCNKAGSRQKAFYWYKQAADFEPYARGKLADFKLKKENME